MNFQCTTAAFTVSHEPEGFVIFGSLAQRLSLVCGFCTSARTFALRLPPHSPSRDCTCLKLVVVISRRLYRQSDVGSPTGDFHPISSCPCRAYQKNPGDAYGAPDLGVRPLELIIMASNENSAYRALKKYGFLIKEDYGSLKNIKKWPKLRENETFKQWKLRTFDEDVALSFRSILSIGSITEY